MWVILQEVLIVFNFTNVYNDAYRILQHKKIAHGINFGAYFIFACITYYFFTKPELSFSGFPYLDFGIWLLNAFCNRQISFDIPLNLRRGLKWNYVSLDNPPKSITDQVEIFVFGRNGTVPVIVYSALWFITFLIQIIWLH